MLASEKKRLSLLTAALTVAVLFLLLATLPAMAQGSGSGATTDNTFPHGIFRNGTLNASLSDGTDFSFSSPSVGRDLTFRLTNPENSSMQVFLALDRDDQWNVISNLGTLKPGESKDFTYKAGFNYTGKTNETDVFGVIGKTQTRYVGKIFRIHEDWAPYERVLKSTLSVIGVPSALVLLVILVIVMAGTLAAAINIRHRNPGEYTMETLFFSFLRAQSISEFIADIILTPFFWVVEFFLGAILVLIILLITLYDIRPDIGILIFFIGGVAALFMPLIFLVIGWIADYYDREPFRFIMAMFMWGVMATFFAFFVNTALSIFLELFIGSGVAMLLIAVIIAPIVEETAKGLGLLILAGHHEFDSMFDGILFGFAVGMGFAAIENWLYFASNAGPVTMGGLVPWVYLILYRSLLGSLSHGCFTAATGAVIGYFKSRDSLKRFTLFAFFLGLPVAMILHASFNFAAILDSVMQSLFGTPVPVFDPLLAISVTTIYIIIGVILQLRIKDRLMRRGPKPEG
ncbi:MAG: PrsW family intramembrane metalloprotease [Methanocella sp.]